MLMFLALRIAGLNYSLLWPCGQGVSKPVGAGNVGSRFYDIATPVETEGERPPDFENQLRFGAALARLAAEDPDVHKLVAEVRHLIRPRSDLQAPELVARVQALMTPG